MSCGRGSELVLAGIDIDGGARELVGDDLSVELHRYVRHVFAFRAGDYDDARSRAFHLGEPGGAIAAQNLRALVSGTNQELAMRSTKLVLDPMALGLLVGAEARRGGGWLGARRSWQERRENQ